MAGPGWREARDAAGFRRDPLAYLSGEFAAGRDVWRSGSGLTCVANPEAAREVLGNRRGAFAETSDFFHTRTGVFGSRAEQVAIGRAARGLLRAHLDARSDRLPGLVANRLAPVSLWPDAGNLLVRAHLRDVLLHPDAPRALREVLDAVVARAVLAGARERYSAVSRLAFRRSVRRTLVRAVRDRRRTPRPAAPRDLLDVVVDGAAPGADAAQLAEVYLSFLFATVGSIGFALGWTVHLVGTRREVGAGAADAGLGPDGDREARPRPGPDDDREARPRPEPGPSPGPGGDREARPRPEPGPGPDDDRAARPRPDAGPGPGDPERLVREALRLWPVAWLFARTPLQGHELGGVRVGPGDEVAVCTYLVHRHPAYWEHPDAFLPDRWAAPGHDPAFLPFGYGPHTCTGATVTMTLLTDLIRILTRDWHLTVTESGGGPHLGPALAPPRFTAELRVRATGAEGR